jgi:phage terminase large subunit
MLVEECLAEKGTLAVCIREVQKTLAQSSKRLIESKIKEMGVGPEFRVFNDKIQTPGDGIIIFQGMQDHTAESIKSLEGFRIADIEEAQTLSARSLTLLRPTIRAPGSQIWARWNPRRKKDAIDVFLRQGKPDNSIVVQANWKDNPFWSAELEAERQLDLKLYPDQYEHVWEGGYVTAVAGAYYAKPLAEAKLQGRIGNVAADPLLTLRAIWDIGGTGAKADAVAIWICQFVGKEIRWLDYYEAVGQPLATHVQWLRDNGYAKALCVLPHDGETNDKVYDVSYESALKDAQFETLVIPNQGKGAAKMRIEAARRLFPSMWFNEKTTEAGRDALGWYHEKKSDDDRNIGLGPNHDWSSHGADAFGLGAVAYEEPKVKQKQNSGPRASGGWMGN